MTPETTVLYFVATIAAIGCLWLVGVVVDYTLTRWPLCWRATLDGVLKRAEENERYLRRKKDEAVQLAQEWERKWLCIRRQWREVLANAEKDDPWVDYAGRVLKLVEKDQPVVFAAYMGPVGASICYGSPAGWDDRQLRVPMVRVGVSIGFTPETPTHLVAEEIGRRVEQYVLKQMGVAA